MDKKILAPDGTPVYREPTVAELNSTDPKTPHRHVRPVRISCPNGVVINSKVRFEGGEELQNILRAVIALEPPNPKTKRSGTALIYITRFNNEIGKVVFEVADCLVGEDPQGVSDGEVIDS